MQTPFHHGNGAKVLGTAVIIKVLLEEGITGTSNLMFSIPQVADTIIAKTASRIFQPRLLLSVLVIALVVGVSRNDLSLPKEDNLELFGISGCSISGEFAGDDHAVTEQE